MIDRVAFSILGIEIYWYGLVYALGFLITLFFLRRYHSSLGLTKDQTDMLLLITMLGGIIGGRIAHIVFYEPGYYFANIFEIIRLDKGGMSIHGGIVGGIIGLYYMSKKYQVSFFKLTDYIVIPLSLVLAFGRIANFINQELVGKVTSSQLGVVFPKYDEQNRWPSQLFESIKNMIVFQMLLYLHYFKTIQPGILTALFLIFYNGLRFIVDFTREPAISIGIISMGQVLSLVGTIIGIILLIGLRKNIFSQKISGIEDHSKNIENK